MRTCYVGIILISLFCCACGSSGDDQMYRYDAAGRLVEFKSETGKLYRYEYDAAGNITEIKEQ